VFQRLWNFYKHPFRRRLIWVSAGIGVFLYMIYQRYFPKDVVFGVFRSSDPMQLMLWPFQILSSKAWWQFWLIVVLFVFLWLLWLFFFAQFVLPVQGGRDRFKVFWQLVRYVFGRHGPAMFIQDGEMIANRRERNRPGPGVLVLDTASAAVLRTGRNFTRAVGPGVVFTQPGEWVDTVLDLRKQVTVIGPTKDEDDPFLPRGEDETDEAYEKRVSWRQRAGGRTRDGVEVVPRLTVVFALDKHPDDLSEEAYEEGRFRTNFYGHEASVWRAVTHRPVDADKAVGGTGIPQERLLSWQWLPQALAVDLWREYIQRVRLSQLFEAVDESGQTALNMIASTIKERLSSPQYHELGVDARPTGEVVTSREYQLLQEHGLRVMSVSISAIYLPPEVEQMLIERWSSNWLDRARREGEMVARKRALAQKRGAEAAVLDWGRMVVEVCGTEVERIPSREQCLARLLAATRDALRSDPDLYQAAQEEIIAALDEIWAWYQRADASTLDEPNMLIEEEH